MKVKKYAEIIQNSMLYITYLTFLICLASLFGWLFLLLIMGDKMSTIQKLLIMRMLPNANKIIETFQKPILKLRLMGWMPQLQYFFSGNGSCLILQVHKTLLGAGC